jgi:hypothetical protein
MSQPDLHAKNNWFSCVDCGGTRPMRELAELVRHDPILNISETVLVCADGAMCDLLRRARVGEAVVAALAKEQKRRAAEEAVDLRVKEGERVMAEKDQPRRKR